MTDASRLWPVLSLLVLVINGARAETGAWTPASSFSQLNVACSRKYTCGPKEDVIYSADSKVVQTAPKTVWGVCSAGTGPIDTCNICLTNPPTERCEWHVESK